MTQRHTHHTRVVTRFTRIPEPLPDGKVRCICGKAVALTPNGRIRRHKTPAGDECTHDAFYNDPPDVEAPPVAIPITRPRMRQPRDSGEMARLDVGSYCLTCDRWIPGERSYCGQCLRKRGRL